MEKMPPGRAREFVQRFPNTTLQSKQEVLIAAAVLRTSARLIRNAYKIAENILSASSAPDSGFSSVDLYGSSVQKKNEGSICSIFHLENENGTGDITVYHVFPGMELVYNDMHMEYCKKTQNPRSGIIEINYCREGRCECAFGKQSYCYMAAGDLSICSLQRRSHTSSFPTSHTSVPAIRTLWTSTATS